MTEEIILKNKEKIYALTTECVIHLHDLLSKNYHLVDKMDPVEPPGIKNINSLESAVYRQHTGTQGWYKYDSIFKSCATLIFGIIKNHPFHNGNKRVAFLAMIKHLFENGYVIKANTKHNDIYNILLSIADNSFYNQLSFIDKTLYRQYKSKEKWDDEKVVTVLSCWLRKICDAKNYSFKSKIRLQRIKEMLERKDIQIELNGTWLTLFQEKDKKVFGIFSAGRKRYNERTYGIGNSMSEIGIKVVNQIRRDFGLTQKDGFDNNAFYDTETFIDEEMVTYKRIIYRLSQT